MAKGSITILGCGSSGGVPLATGYWGACDPDNPKNRRLRASLAVQVGDVTLIIDTGPDFREQTLRYGLKNISAILYTHAHADHVNGIDELRYIKFVQDGLIDIYGDLPTLEELQARFSHIFFTTPDGLYKPVVNATVFHNDQYGKPINIAGIDVIPFHQTHGIAGQSLGYRFGDFAYSTDVSGLDDAAIVALKGIRTWIVDCAQFGTDYVVVHPNLDVVRAWNEKIGASRVILTHMTPRIDYQAMTDQLPPGYEAAYDGLVLEFEV